MWPFVRIDRPERFRGPTLPSSSSDPKRAIRRARSPIVVRGTLFLTLSLALATAVHYRAASSAPAVEREVLAGLVPSIERAFRELDSSDRRLSEDPVLLPAALTTVSGLKEDGQRLAEDLRSVNAWAKDLARLDQHMEESIATARADERSKTVLRYQWMGLKRRWDERLGPVRNAHLEWIDAVASVHLFMEERLGRTSVDGEAVVFETDADAREFNKLMQDVAVAAQRIVSSNEQFKVAMRTVAEEALGAPPRETRSMLALLRAAGNSARGAAANRIPQ
jgi:hypothetical protein